MKNLIALLSSQKDVGYLIMRIVGGGTIFWAGWLKMFNSGFSGVTKYLDSKGMIIPEVMGPFLVLLEFVGGAAVILGLFTRFLGVLYTIEFIVAFLLVKSGMAYQAFRIDIVLVAFGILLATHGAGKYSLDRMFKLEQ